MINEMLPKNGASFTDALLLGGIDAVKLFVGWISFTFARKYRLDNYPFPDKAYDWFQLALFALFIPYVEAIFLIVIVYFLSLGDGGFIQIYTLMAICSLLGTFAIKHDEIVGYIHEKKKQSESEQSSGPFGL